MRRLLSRNVKLFLWAALLLASSQLARAEVASVYGGSDGLCGSRTANGERLNCSAMTAAHRTLPFGTLVRVCHSGCVVVRINDRGPFVRGRHIVCRRPRRGRSVCTKPGKSPFRMKDRVVTSCPPSLLRPG